MKVVILGGAEALAKECKAGYRATHGHQQKISAGFLDHILFPFEATDRLSRFHYKVPINNEKFTASRKLDTHYIGKYLLALA